MTPSQRRFEAFAKPRAGHPDGHAVLLVEISGRSRRERVFTRAEAEQVRAELDAALRAFFVGEAFCGPHASGARNPRASAADGQSPLRPDGPGAPDDGPRGCAGPYPFTDHRSLAEAG